MDTRRPMIAGNWKMFKTADEAAQTARELLERIGNTPRPEVMIAPPFTALSAVAAVITDSPVALGAQNMHWETEGAYTGEIAPGMLVAAGCRYVILGHSERRQYFGETDQSVNRKIKSALEAGLAPVLCVGETEAQRRAEQTFTVLDKQVTDGLQNLALGVLSRLVIAYEPVWAIGSGLSATAEQAQEVHLFLRNWITDNLGAALAGQLRILYGGSVKPANVAELMAQPDIDGALVGGASLMADTFAQLVAYR
ncbi:MAG: triose-phosphate isomerase [Desulfobacterales bacterium]